jgi:hypothetical protein
MFFLGGAPPETHALRFEVPTFIGDPKYSKVNGFESEFWLPPHDAPHKIMTGQIFNCKPFALKSSKAESLNNQLIRKHMPMSVYALRFQRSSSKTELKPLINS